MANGSFDVAMGRETEFYARVDGNDPANSALILVVLAATGLEDDAVLRTYATLSTLLAASNNEVTNTNYARKTLTDATLAAYTVDTVNHRITLTFPDQTFATILAGDSWQKFVVCYDNDTTGGTDANIVPVTFHDILVDGVALVPNGGNIYVSAPTGFAIAS